MRLSGFHIQGQRKRSHFRLQCLSFFFFPLSSCCFSSFQSCPLCSVSFFHVCCLSISPFFHWCLATVLILTKKTTKNERVDWSGNLLLFAARLSRSSFLLYFTVTFAQGRHSLPCCSHAALFILLLIRVVCPPRHQSFLHSPTPWLEVGD